MPGLIEFVRQYGLREYVAMVTVAAVCGIGVAALINFSSQGVAGGQALLKTRAKIESESSRLLTTRVSHQARTALPARHRVRSHALRQAPAAGPRRVSPRPAARLVAVRTPAHAPKPVVRAPAPAPKPTLAPKQRSSGGGQKPKGQLQFDDSG
jgi:hypothetical protein